MKKYLTEEQMKFIDMVCDEYEDEFKTWLLQCESQLQLWYVDNLNYDLVEASMKFAYYCADRFMKFRSVVSMMG